MLGTTSLSDLLGTKARAKIESGVDGDNADILLTAVENGTAFNGVVVQYVDDNLLEASAGLTAGNEVVEYDTVARSARASLSFFGCRR